MSAKMSELIWAGYIANRVDVWNVGFKKFVDFDRTTVAQFDPEFLQSEPLILARRPTAINSTSNSI